MKTRSAKAKGKRLCNYVRAKLLEWAPDLQGGDIMVPPTSTPGCDLWLSPKAKEVYPLAIESKNQEQLNIWSALKQARTHVKDGERPVVAFSRNREGKVYVALDLDDFLYLIR